MMIIIYNFYINNFKTFDFNLDSHNNNHIFISRFKNDCTFLIISYLIIFKINVLMYQIHIVYDTQRRSLLGAGRGLGPPNIF